MPLAKQEIVPGAVAILDAPMLLADNRVVHDRSGGSFRAGPFLCVQVLDDTCLWLHVTRQKDERGIRLKLQAAWRLEGSPTWSNRAQYISDARKPFIGPLDSFVAAGANELPHQPHSRPSISPAGLAAVVAEMQRYGAKTL